MNKSDILNNVRQREKHGICGILRAVETVYFLVRHCNLKVMIFLKLVVMK